MENENLTQLLSDISEMQNQIYGIDSSSYDEVLNLIKESNLIKSKASFAEILFTIKKSIKYSNLNRNELYYSLINELKNDILKLFTKKELCFHIFWQNEMRLKLLSFQMIDIKDIILYIKSRREAERKELVELYSEYIKPYLSEIFRQDEEEEESYELDYRIPFLSNKTSDDNDEKNKIVIRTSDSPKQSSEIEENAITILIKKAIIEDDIDSFQSVISSTNTSINQYITEKYFSKKLKSKLTLIDFAALNGSIKIFKFLILNNNIIVNREAMACAIGSRNYEIFHIIESTNKNFLTEYGFEKVYLDCAIQRNNSQIIDYLIENYDYNLFEEKMMKDYLTTAMDSYNYDVFLRILTHAGSTNNGISKERLINVIISCQDDISRKESDNIIDKIIDNGGFRMFVVILFFLYDSFKEKYRHKFMKFAFQNQNNDIIEFLLKKDIMKKANQNQNENCIDNLFEDADLESNLSIYKDDLDCITSVFYKYLETILFIFNLIQSNKEKFKVFPMDFFNKANSSNQTIFHAAAKNNWTEILEFFIRNQLKLDCISIKDFSGCTPLHIAVEYHSTAFIKMFISNKEKLYGQSTNFVDELNSVEYEGFTPFLLAVRNGYIDIVEFLLSVDEINVNMTNDLKQNALQIAVDNGHIKMLKYLTSNVPLYASSHGEKIDVTKSIDFENRDVNGQNLLHIAAYVVGDAVSFKNVFSPALLNVKDNENHTPLHFAAYTGNDEIMEDFLQFVDCESGESLEVDAKGIENETPLHWAAENGFIDVVKLLCEKGKADINAVDKNGQTPKQRAEQNGHTAVVDYFNQFEIKNCNH